MSSLGNFLYLLPSLFFVNFRSFSSHSFTEKTVIKLDTQLAPPSTDAEKKVRQIFDKLEKVAAKSKERQGL